MPQDLLSGEAATYQIRQLAFATDPSVVSTAVGYDVAEVVDPRVHVVAKFPKSVLTTVKLVN